MKYLIIKNWIYGTYTTNELTREDLAKMVNGETECIVNLIDMTYFDSDKNQWVKIEPKKQL